MWKLQDIIIKFNFSSTLYFALCLEFGNIFLMKNSTQIVPEITGIYRTLKSTTVLELYWSLKKIKATSKISIIWNKNSIFRVNNVCVVASVSASC